MTGPATQTRRRSHGVWVATCVAGTVALVALVALAVAYPTWGWMSAEAAGQVEVVAGPGRAPCHDNGRLAVRTADEGGVPDVAFRLEAERGAWCQVPISVRNDSGRTITVHDLSFPALLRDQSDNHGALLVDSDASGVKAHRGDDPGTAVIDVEEQLAPGEASSYLIRVVVNPYACVDAGVWGVPDVPKVGFSVLGREHVTSGALSLEAKISGTGLTWSGCTS